MKDPKVIEVGGVRVTPIELKEEEKNLPYEALTKGGNLLDLLLLLAAEKVLDIMLNNTLTADPNKNTVWHYWTYYEDPLEYSWQFSHREIGGAFQDTSFGSDCYFSSEERVKRTMDCGLICSHQNRNPQKNQLGGCARLVFELIPKKNCWEEESTIITGINACAGLKEWENLAFVLGIYRLLGLVDLSDSQIKAIVEVADKSVGGEDPDVFCPVGTTICQYVENLFNIIDKNEKPTFI